MNHFFVAATNTDACRSDDVIVGHRISPRISRQAGLLFHLTSGHRFARKHDSCDCPAWYSISTVEGAPYMRHS